ncbi:hypothetical protein ACS0TY_013525 [Phlomoides rotata]
MEGQLQLRREDNHEQDREPITKLQQLPLQSSPYLKCTDLDKYKFIDYGSAVQDHKGGGTTAPTDNVTRQADDIETKLK